MSFAADVHNLLEELTITMPGKQSWCCGYSMLWIQCAVDTVCCGYSVLWIQWQSMILIFHPGARTVQAAVEFMTKGKVEEGSDPLYY